MIGVALTGACAAGPQGGQASAPDVSVEEVSALDDELLNAGSAFIAQCMAAHGFPQLSVAAHQGIERHPTATRKPLRSDPLEAGPCTAEQAERYGIGGTSQAFTASEPGYVASADPSYDRQLGACAQDLDRRRGAAAAALPEHVAQLLNDMQNEFVDAFTKRVAPLLVSRLTCVRAAGYPTLSTDPFLSATAALDSAGVAHPPEPAATTTPVPAPAPAPGTAVVTDPVAEPAYLPSAAEVTFGKAYVRCGIESGFVSAWWREQAVPRREVLTQHRKQLNQAGVALKEVTERIDAYLPYQAMGN
jgi:hypothetical protein